ncbi:OTU domain-containing protein [Blumeria hordei DH14]|uniref:OTU domain-containing protein n=1 Tax=Blumeria graminis f. sp. hordei (strain DH14) TaxID=546991 RepID=N1JIF6_BLUG1|nr:OTU domain-containing protein [Blumeria hordei DH14]
MSANDPPIKVTDQNTETFSDLQRRHRSEQKELQAKVIQKKKGATKSTRKAINSECEILEKNLGAKHKQELMRLNDEVVEFEKSDDANQRPLNKCSSNCENSAAKSCNNDELSTSMKSFAPTQSVPSGEVAPKKRNRQKERLARRAAELQVSVDDAQKEASNQLDKRALERKAISDQMHSKGLSEKVIRPDGHCLFSAVADQLVQIGVSLGEGADGLKEYQLYTVVRKAAAKYIESHPDEFIGWLDEPLIHYVEKIRDTAEWGGHLELLALSRFYNVVITIIQDGASHNIEPSFTENRHPANIWLAYYRHGYGLGEHYNSLRQITLNTEA